MNHRGGKEKKNAGSLSQKQKEEPNRLNFFRNGNNKGGKWGETLFYMFVWGRIQGWGNCEVTLLTYLS